MFFFTKLKFFVLQKKNFSLQIFCLKSVLSSTDEKGQARKPQRGFLVNSVRVITCSYVTSIRV